MFKYNKQESILNFSRLRVTDLPTNWEIYLPDERSDRVEAGLQAFSAEMNQVARNYINQNVDKAGNVKESNLTDKQVVGLNDIERIIQNKNFIVTKTDKSGRQCLLTEEEYIQMGEQHVDGDEVKTRKDAERMKTYWIVMHSSFVDCWESAMVIIVHEGWKAPW